MVANEGGLGFNMIFKWTFQIPGFVWSSFRLRIPAEFTHHYLRLVPLIAISSSSVTPQIFGPRVILTVITACHSVIQVWQFVEWSEENKREVRIGIGHRTRNSLVLDLLDLWSDDLPDWVHGEPRQIRTGVCARCKYNIRNGISNDNEWTWIYWNYDVRALNQFYAFVPEIHISNAMPQNQHQRWYRLHNIYKFEFKCLTCESHCQFGLWIALSIWQCLSQAKHLHLNSCQYTYQYRSNIPWSRVR